MSFFSDHEQIRLWMIEQVASHCCAYSVEAATMTDFLIAFFSRKKFESSTNKNDFSVKVLAFLAEKNSKCMMFWLIWTFRNDGIALWHWYLGDAWACTWTESKWKLEKVKGRKRSSIRTYMSFKDLLYCFALRIEFVALRLERNHHRRWKKN